MFVPRMRWPLILLAVHLLPVAQAWALGEELGESKEQLKLQYEVSATDHGTGRVTVTLTLADEGRLKPLNSIDLVIPDQQKSQAGGHWMDLVVSLATREEDGKRVARAHLRREWAERAEFRLTTSCLDGKQEPLTWYYHVIPLAKLVRQAPRPVPGGPHSTPPAEPHPQPPAAENPATR